MKGKKTKMDTLAMAMKLAEQYQNKYGGRRDMTMFPEGGANRRPDDMEMFMENEGVAGQDPLYGIPTQDRYPGAEYGYGSRNMALGEDPAQEEEKNRRLAGMMRMQTARKRMPRY